MGQMHDENEVEGAGRVSPLRRALSNESRFPSGSSGGCNRTFGGGLAGFVDRGGIYKYIYPRIDGRIVDRGGCGGGGGKEGG
ncbi:hypothetical protein FKM82_024196 [Ascaphus truei]